MSRTRYRVSRRRGKRTRGGADANLKSRTADLQCRRTFQAKLDGLPYSRLKYSRCKWSKPQLYRKTGKRHIDWVKGVFSKRPNPTAKRHERLQHMMDEVYKVNQGIAEAKRWLKFATDIHKEYSEERRRPSDLENPGVQQLLKEKQDDVTRLRKELLDFLAKREELEEIGSTVFKEQARLYPNDRDLAYWSRNFQELTKDM